ncbi:hypothetical protein [Methanolobus halotolerans]|uniref:Uncharacterized protein n=1 Tax=Methanolobus halotolerans TaxID=2052935 RepID=A0A4E0Q870_9EURY|nr:hypothetical protein [Methanolobus halotolerans]TGC07891.1 hypothetical protein CUN85_10625 [Methanolobus halotolerans]
MEDHPARITKQEVHELLNKGNELLNILEQNYAWNSKEYARNRSRFISAYTKWYKLSLAVIRNLSPDTSKRFQNLFSTNKRSEINEYTYTIQDYIHGSYLESGPRNYTDEVTSRKLKEQMEILRHTSARIDEFSFDLEKFVRINPIYSNQDSFKTTDTREILHIDMDEEHYNSLKTEINSTFRLGLFISTFLLSKELIENLLIDILRLIFPPTSEENISLYFDISNKDFKDMNNLLHTITEKRTKLASNGIDIDEILMILERMKSEDRPTSHSKIKIPDREDIQSYRVGETVEMLLLMKQTLIQKN